MKQRCIDEITQAAGRELSKTELDKIESGIKRAMKEIYNDNPAKARAMQPGEMMAAAVSKAQQNIKTVREMLPLNMPPNNCRCTACLRMSKPARRFFSC